MMRYDDTIQYDMMQISRYSPSLTFFLFSLPPFFSKGPSVFFSLPPPSGWRRRVRQKTVEICMQIFLCPNVLHQSTVAAFPSVREVMELSVGSTSVPSGTKSSFFFNRLIFLYFIFSFSLQTVAAVRRSNHRQFIN